MFWKIYFPTFWYRRKPNKKLKQICSVTDSRTSALDYQHHRPHMSHNCATCYAATISHPPAWQNLPNCNPVNTIPDLYIVKACSIQLTSDVSQSLPPNNPPHQYCISTKGPLFSRFQVMFNSFILEIKRKLTHFLIFYFFFGTLSLEKN